MSLARRATSLMSPLADRFPRLATTYRSVRDHLLFSMEEPTTTPWGFRLAGNEAMANGSFEPAETELVRTILKGVDILVNVGANIGYYCCHALSMGKAVIAFEPIQGNLRYMFKNIKSNGWSGVEIYPIVLSNSVDVLEIYGGGTGASVVKGWAGISESHVTLVPSSTMDVVLATRLRGKRALILVDIEGAEKWMLEGATIMLANDPKPIWLVEIVTTAHQPRSVGMNPNFADTFQLFFQNGYQAFTADNSARSITMEDVELAARGRLEFDSHNFLFRETNNG
jgi:FkbM family methyltransferase